jgi:hypothetical protein
MAAATAKRNSLPNNNTLPFVDGMPALETDALWNDSNALTARGVTAPVDPATVTIIHSLSQTPDVWPATSKPRLGPGRIPTGNKYTFTRESPVWFLQPRPSSPPGVAEFLMGQRCGVKVRSCSFPRSLPKRRRGRPPSHGHPARRVRNRIKRFRAWLRPGQCSHSSGF